MRFPIPSHLHDIFMPTGENNSSFEVIGIIRCRCGHDRFLIESACNRQIVKLHCEKCSQEHLLFHAGKHGWDGFVCGGNTFHPDNTLPPIHEKCENCNSELYHVQVWISSQGPDDFLEECVANDDSFSAEDWVDGFEWITISLTCANCDAVQSDWLDLETM